MCEKINKRKGRPTPCEQCLPELHPRNRQAVELWQLVSSQYIFNPQSGRAIDINQQAVLGVLELYSNRIHDKQQVFEQVVTLARHQLRNG